MTHLMPSARMTKALTPARPPSNASSPCTVLTAQPPGQGEGPRAGAMSTPTRGLSRLANGRRSADSQGALAGGVRGNLLLALCLAPRVKLGLLARDLRHGLGELDALLFGESAGL